jgi:N-acetyl-beta-hexosaminidase
MRNRQMIYSMTKLLLVAAVTVALTTGCRNDTPNPQQQVSLPPEAESQFAVRGFHIDLRIQVMTMEALRALADELAAFGFNTLVMEWEASYPYLKNATISNELSYTREEVKEFIDYCEGKGIDVIPLQQCFGHVEYILRHDRYSDLKEDRKEISQLCPLKEEADSLLFADLFADMASMHSSDFIHIGGDETYLLGHCPACSLKAATEGKSKLFVDYMKMMCNIIIDLGRLFRRYSSPSGSGNGVLGITVHQESS